MQGVSAWARLVFSPTANVCFREKQEIDFCVPACTNRRFHRVSVGAAEVRSCLWQTSDTGEKTPSLIIKKKAICDLQMAEIFI